MIVRGFLGGRANNSSRKRYIRQVMNIVNVRPTHRIIAFPEISFPIRDASGILPYENDLMVIRLQM